MKRCLNPQCGLPNSDSAKRCRYCSLENFAAIETQSVQARGLSPAPEPGPPVVVVSSVGKPVTPTPEPVRAAPPDLVESRLAGKFDPTPFVLTAENAWHSVTRFVMRHKLVSGTAVGIVLTIVLSQPVLDWWHGWQVDPPFVIIIEPLPEELVHGKEGKLIAKYVNPDGELPQFDWEPKTAFVGNTDTNIVTLDMTKLTSTFTVSLRLRDKLRRWGVIRSQQFTIRDPQNHPPRLMSIEPREGQIQAGTSMRIEADVQEPDGEKLRYTWSCDEAPVDQSNAPSTMLHIPEAYARKHPPSVTVNLSITDGKETVSGARIYKISSSPVSSGARQGTFTFRSNNSTTVAPVLFSFQPSRSVVKQGEVVNLSAIMWLRGNEELSYFWSNSTGVLEANGPNAILRTQTVKAESGPVPVVITLVVKSKAGVGSVSARAIISVEPAAETLKPSNYPSPVIAPRPEVSPATNLDGGPKGSLSSPTPGS